MSEPSAPYVAHHFDDADQQHEASALGMWLFLVTEVMFFGGLFVAYVVYRTAFPEAFHAASHELDITLGAFNTAVLLTSSLTMALAVHAAQVSRRGMLVVCLILTIILGSAFLGVKAYEYWHKWHEHLIPGPHFVFHGPDADNAQLFFSLYFAMTGLHAVHMVIGIVLLGILTVRGAQGMFNRFYYTPVELSGLYWHFVDLVWIFLFPLLYLLGEALMSAQVLPIKSCIAVYLVLMALTAVTVGAAFLDMAWLNTPVALIIASFKALLVMMFFMELRHSPRLTWVVIGNGVFWMLILITFVMSDEISRGWLGFPGK